MIKNPVIILGSARSFGETRKAILQVIENNSVSITDLNKFNISPFNYDHNNQDDDYYPLMEKVINNHDLIVLATPVYWYGPSTIMKIFIDRITDLISIRKELGRKLRGKKVFVIASFGTSVPKGFEETFDQICEYLGMNYQGCSFIYSGSNCALQEMNGTQIKKAQNILFNAENR